MKSVTLATCTAIAVSLVTAVTSQSMDHGDHGGQVLGEAASADAATRTIEIVMLETEDGRMIFEPGAIDVDEGETVRFAIVNQGQLEHELVFNTTMEIAAHKAEMMAADHVHTHDSDNALTLQPGESGELAWTFTSAGVFEFACLIPGHYDAGMFGPLTVRVPAF